MMLLLVTLLYMVLLSFGVFSIYRIALVGVVVYSIALFGVVVYSVILFDVVV